MTEDYKEQLLNYITNNLEIENGVDEPQLNEDNNITESNHNSFITQMLINSGYATAEQVEREIPLAGFNQLGRLNPTNSDNTIIYGNMYFFDYSKTPQGAIIISDNQDTYIGYVSEYDSGTKFNELKLLKNDENNLLYGIDKTSDNKYRFLLLNDIISSYLTYSKYVCILRKSYFFPNDYNSVLLGRSIKNEQTIYKEYNGSKYLFIGQTTNYKPVIITVSINVGEENEWNKYQTDDNVDLQSISSFCVWQNDTLQLRFILDYDLNIKEFNFNGTTLSYYGGTSVSGVVISMEMVDLNTAYLVTTSYPYTLNYYKFSNLISTLIYSKQYDNSINAKTCNVNEIVFVLVMTGNNYAEGIINMIIDDEVYEKEITKIVAPTELYVNQKFNLYKIYYLGEEPDVVTIKPIICIGSMSLDYNVNNYNGDQYINYNSLIPHKGTLNDENGLIFSRNLYNKTQINNSTISTIEIPNTMLNDLTIVNKNLFSETNLKMVQDDNIFIKNIYETLFINFISTINVIDEDTNTSYMSSAMKVNNSINTGTQTSYENSACTKYRINYTDTTTSIGTLEWLPINKYNKTTQITFYADKNITSIDLISEDETTVYLNIPVEVEVGNYYTIRQKVRTGNKPTPVQLQYNNENINYNNEPVMVYVEEV